MRFEFDRYVHGLLMAEGVAVERETSLSAAMSVAARIAARKSNGEVPVLVIRQPPAQEWQDISTALKQAVAYADIVAQSEGMPAGKRAERLTATAVNLDGTAFVTAEFDVKKARAAIDALIADHRTK